MSIKIAGYDIDIELIFDIIIILTIIVIALYEVLNGKGDNEGEGNNNEPGIDNKGLFIKNLSKKWLEYKNIKFTLESIMLISFTPMIILTTIIGFIGLCFSLYNLIANKLGTVTLYPIFIFIILLLCCTLYFIFLSKRLKNFRLNEQNINFFNKFIIIFLGVIIYFRFSILLSEGILYLLNKLNIPSFVEALIESSSGFSTAGTGLAILFGFSCFSSSKDSSENDGYDTMDNIPINDEEIDNESIDNESIDKTLTYEDLINSNKKLEEKTGFHQGSLLE